MYHNSPDLDRIESVRLYVYSRTEIYVHADTAPLMYGGDLVKEIDCRVSEDEPRWPGQKHFSVAGEFEK